MPLNPALRLTPQDPREVSFTLGLSFSDNKNCSAVTLIELGYHDSVGNTGSFSLVNMSPDAVSLSKLLDENVLINYEGAAPYVIAPIGLQIGNDASVKAVEYLPLSLPDVSPEVLTTNPIPNISIENIDKREAINTIINQKQLVDQLVSALDNGEPIAFELCAGLIVDKCERALVKAVENHTHLDLALEALTIQHAIHPNDTLSDTIMQNLSATKTFYASRSPQDTSQLLRDMAFVLAAKKAGNWADPILELAKLQQGSYWTDVCDILTAVKDQLTEIQSKQENIICAPPIYPTRAVPTDAPTWAVPTDAREPTEPS